MRVRAWISGAWLALAAWSFGNGDFAHAWVSLGVSALFFGLSFVAPSKTKERA